MRLASLAIALAFPTVTAACMNKCQYLDPQANLPVFADDDYGDDASYYNDALEFSGRGALSGEIGPVKGFRGSDGVTITGFDDGVGTYVTITGVGENGTGFLYVDVMPRVDEMPEGSHAIVADDVTYEGTIVTAHADSNDGDSFDGTATDGDVTLVKHADGTRELEVRSFVSDGNGGETESIGMFRLQPKR